MKYALFWLLVFLFVMLVILPVSRALEHAPVGTRLLFALVSFVAGIGTAHFYPDKEGRS